MSFGDEVEKQREMLRQKRAGEEQAARDDEAAAAVRKRAHRTAQETGRRLVREATVHLRRSGTRPQRLFVERNGIFGGPKEIRVRGWTISAGLVLADVRDGGFLRAWQRAPIAGALGLRAPEYPRRFRDLIRVEPGQPSVPWHGNVLGYPTAVSESRRIGGWRSYLHAVQSDTSPYAYGEVHTEMTAIDSWDRYEILVPFQEWLAAGVARAQELA